MIPCIYYKTQLESQWQPGDFAFNGLGPLSDCISCTVTEERLGEYTLYLEYPVDGVRAELIEVGGGITAKNGEREGIQMFRIGRVRKGISRIQVYANHISYDLFGYPVPALNLGYVDASLAMDLAFEQQIYPLENPFDYICDLQSAGTIESLTPRDLRSLIQGSEDSIVSVMGGEVQWDNYTVRLSQNRGRDAGTVIYYGKNLTEYDEDITIEECYTHIYPYAIKIDTSVNLNTGEIEQTAPETITLPEKVVSITGAYDQGHKKVLVADVTAYIQSEEPVSAITLRYAMNRYLNENDIKNPKIMYKIKWINREQVQGGDGYDALGLCDNVKINMTKYDTIINSKVIKTVYNSLLEQFEEITVGNAKREISQTVAKMQKQLQGLQAHVFDITRHAQNGD